MQSARLSSEADGETRRAKIREGVELFNRLEFWEAHDSWEKVWLIAEGEEKLFVQGMIQLAAAYLHVERGSPRPAARLFGSGLAKLSSIDASFAGVDCSEVIAAATRHLEWALRKDRGEFRLEEFPRLGLTEYRD